MQVLTQKKPQNPGFLCKCVAAYQGPNNLQLELGLQPRSLETALWFLVQRTEYEREYSLDKKHRKERHEKEKVFLFVVQHELDIFLPSKSVFPKKNASCVDTSCHPMLGCLIPSPAIRPSTGRDDDISIHRGFPDVHCRLGGVTIIESLIGYYTRC